MTSAFRIFADPPKPRSNKTFVRWVVLWPSVPLWLAKAGPYASVDNPDTLLAERIESMISPEHSKWVSVQVAEKEQ